MTSRPSTASRRSRRTSSSAETARSSRWNSPATRGTGDRRRPRRSRRRADRVVDFNREGPTMTVPWRLSLVAAVGLSLLLTSVRGTRGQFVGGRRGGVQRRGVRDRRWLRHQQLRELRRRQQRRELRRRLVARLWRPQRRDRGRIRVGERPLRAGLPGRPAADDRRRSSPSTPPSRRSPDGTAGRGAGPSPRPPRPAERPVHPAIRPRRQGPLAQHAPDRPGGRRARPRRGRRGPDRGP